MAELAFKERVAQSIESRTLDKIVNVFNDDGTMNQEFIESLFEIEDTEGFTNALKEKLSLEEANEKIEENEIKSNSDEDVILMDSDTDHKEVAQCFSVISAEEIRPELVAYIKDELMAKMQADRLSMVDEFINGKAVSQEEFYKLTLLSSIPFLGIFLYLFSLMVLSINRRRKYNPSLQNFAKSQLKTYWIYLLAHASVLFVAAASMTSLINIIERGLAA